MAHAPLRNDIVKTSKMSLVAIGLLTAGLLLLSSCGGSDTSENQNTDNSSQQTEQQNTSENTSTSNEQSTNPADNSPDSSASSDEQQSSTTTDDDPSLWKAQMTDETRAIMSEVVAAQGGLGALQKIQSIHSIASAPFSMMGVEGDVSLERWINMPNQTRFISKVENVDEASTSIVQVWDGTQGWIQVPNPESGKTEVVEIPAESAPEVLVDIEFHPILALSYINNEKCQYQYNGTEDVNGVEAYSVTYKSPMGAVGTFYYAVETNYPIRFVRSAANGIEIEQLFGDYQETAGYYFPYSQTNRTTTAQGGENELSVTYSEVEINAEVQQELFDKPNPDA